MNKADRLMIKSIHDIMNYGYKDINPRPKYADGTPAHTFSINHVVRQYDLNKGEFPICSLRPMAWKTGIKEIFTIYQKPTNEIAKIIGGEIGTLAMAQLASVMVPPYLAMI